MTTPYNAARLAGLDQNRGRSQQEILDRILDAINRGDQGDECNEYMRQARFIPLVLRSVYEDCGEDVFGPKMAESCASISDSAKRYIYIVEWQFRRNHVPRMDRIIAQYRAWKWLLGHRDTDTFTVKHCPVTGHFQLRYEEIYSRLLAQIQSGQWDTLTKESEIRTSEQNITQVGEAERTTSHARAGANTSPGSSGPVERVSASAN